MAKTILNFHFDCLNPNLTCNCDQNGVGDDYDYFHTGRQNVFIEEEIDCHANLLDQRQSKIVSHHPSLKNKILELSISLSTNADKLLCLRVFLNIRQLIKFSIKLFQRVSAASSFYQACPTLCFSRLSSQKRAGIECPWIIVRIKLSFYY